MTLQNLTDYGAQAIIAMLFDNDGSDPYTIPVTWWGALMTVAGGETSAAGTEVAAGDYARIEIAATIVPASPETVKNQVAALNWGTPLVDWGTVVEVRLYDAAVDGSDGSNCWFYYTISPGVECDADIPALVPINGFLQGAA